MLCPLKKKKKKRMIRKKKKGSGPRLAGDKHRSSKVVLDYGEGSCQSDFIYTFLIEVNSNAEYTLRKHAYSNTLKILPPKMINFQIRYSDIFHISRRGGSNEYPQSMFLSRNNKNNVYPCKPQFYYIKVGFKGVKII